MERSNDTYIDVGKRLKRFLEEMNVSVADLSAVTKISEKRINEIIDAKGRKMTIPELVVLQERTLISADYLAGTTDFPFPFEPTEDNKRRFADELNKILKK